MKRFLFAIIILFPFSSSAQVCSPNGYTILTINGILTSQRDAQANKDALQRKLPEIYKHEAVTVNYLFNPSHTLGILDIMDTIDQGYFDEKTDYDLDEIRTEASNQIKTQKVLVVGHSQGNFYANNLYETIAGEEGGVPVASIGVYGVATPASIVAGNGNYVTSDTDKIITKLASRISKIKSPNIHINLKKGDDPNGHSFSGVYLKYQGNRISTDIISSLDNLNSNDVQYDDLCIAPPKPSFSHRFEGIFLDLSDAVLHTIITIPINASLKFGNMIIEGTDAIAKGISNTFSSLTRSVSKDMHELVGNNQASAILAFDHPSLINLDVSENETAPSDNNDSVISSDLSAVVPDISSSSQFIWNNENSESITQSSNQATLSYRGGGGNSGHPIIDSSNDIVAPIISLAGTNMISIILGSIYNELGASAFDDIDGSIAVTISGFVDTSTLGSYSITYTAVDDASNTASVIRTINVVSTFDIDPPVISMIGNSSLSIEKDSVYVDLGATALDAIDGLINVTVNGHVDVSIIGTYDISYTATDSSGNVSTSTRTVNVYDHIPQNENNTIGIKKYFNKDNKILYIGNFLICDNNSRSIYTRGNNAGVTDFISASSWQSQYQGSPNINMPVGKNFRYILGEESQSALDCAHKTYVNDYSDTFHYVTSSGSSVVVSNPKFIDSFKVGNISGIIDDSLHTIALAIPPDTDVSELIPTIAISQTATISPNIGVPQDFTNPVTYSVTALDGSVQDYTVYILPTGEKFYFDLRTNQIQYRGDFLICNIDARTVISNGNNIGVSFSVSSSNWQTAYQATSNSNMTPRVNYRYIFGTPIGAIADCTNSTYFNAYSDVFHYATSSGSSVIYSTYSHEESSEKAITSFVFAELNPSVGGIIDENAHTIHITVPFGTNITALEPTIVHSPLSIISPDTNIQQDFTNPVPYIVMAEDGSIQTYPVIVTIAPEIISSPNLNLPTITGYSFNGVSGNITIDPLATDLQISMIANKNVNWVSIKIENQDYPGFYKIFQSGTLCVDGTSVCTKTWNGMLSSGGPIQDGIYRIKVHMKDESNNDFNEYLSPYAITVNVPE